MLETDSLYSALVIVSKVEIDEKMDPTIQTTYFLSGTEITLNNSFIDNSVLIKNFTEYCIFELIHSN